MPHPLPKLIWNYRGTLTITNSTISGNSATEASFGIGIGGGILNDGGTVAVTNCTISGNTAQIRGGGIRTFGGGTVRARNTITIQASADLSANSFAPLPEPAIADGSGSLQYHDAGAAGAPRRFYRLSP